MTTWTQVPAGVIHAANQRLWVALGEKAGVVATRINTDPTFVANIAQLMVNGSYRPSNSEVRAREIMGKNIFGVEEAIGHFGINLSNHQLADFSEVPFSEEVLTACKDTHILVAMFPLSILDIRDIANNQPDQTLFYSQNCWYDEQAFAKDKGEVGWQLVRKDKVANSTNKSWDDQQVLISKDEETLGARIVVYTMVAHFLATGERLFEKIYVRCVDLFLDGCRVSVGSFGAKGLCVYWYDDSRYDGLGVSAVRKQ